ncbi:MAG: zinc ribbon domain-containing protein [Bacteroidetes bacterium]|nr:zinc ribbon domain-containing protein [Bacteroidota bacterium]MCH8032917.1 zinc ribbon domain-containing protein [Bacteroidota bacterium]
MPTYDYRCLSCGNNFEVFQYMTEKHLSSCPKCGGKVKRLIGAGAGPIFKGSGFYQTDYKNSSNDSNQKSDKKTSTVTEAPKKTKDTSEKSPK